MATSDLQDKIMKLKRQLVTVYNELRWLRSRVLSTDSTAISYPLVPRSPLVATHHRLIVQITADNQDGTYQAKRKIALGKNTFADDPEQTGTITVANVAEMSGYVGDLSVDQILCAHYDGLDGLEQPIYHVWSKP